MAGCKKIVISLPEGLLNEFSKLDECNSISKRNELIQEAVVCYIEEKKKNELRELMKRGYQEMACINSELAECGVCCDCNDYKIYEAILAESDTNNDASSEKRRYILC